MIISLPQDSAATQRRCSEHRTDVCGTLGAPHAAGHDTSQRAWFGGVGDRGEALCRRAETFCLRLVWSRYWPAAMVWFGGQGDRETGDRPNPDSLKLLSGTGFICGWSRYWPAAMVWFGGRGDRVTGDRPNPDSLNHFV